MGGGRVFFREALGFAACGAMCARVGTGLGGDHYTTVVFFLVQFCNEMLRILLVHFGSVLDNVRVSAQRGPLGFVYINRRRSVSRPWSGASRGSEYSHLEV